MATDFFTLVTADSVVVFVLDVQDEFNLLSAVDVLGDALDFGNINEALHLIAVEISDSLVSEHHVPQLPDAPAFAMFSDFKATENFFVRKLSHPNGVPVSEMNFLHPCKFFGGG